MYKFSDHFFAVEIEGHKFPAKPDAAAFDRGRRVLDNLTKSGCRDESAIAAAIDGIIDSFIGAGNAAKIFEGREFDLTEHLSVMKYIIDEAAAFVAKAQTAMPEAVK